MTKDDSQKKVDNDSSQTQTEEELNARLMLLQDRENLKDKGLFRQQVLAYLERIALAQERQADVLADSLKEDSEVKK